LAAEFVVGVLTEVRGYTSFNNDDHKFFKTEKMKKFKEFKDRVAIDWGARPLAWVQNLL